MANTLQIKRSTTAGNVPQLAAGELGANLPDNTLYVGQDDYTKLLIHGGGADGTSTFKDASPSGHTVTTVGDPTHETEQKKFGASSIKFDGLGDYLSVPTDASWTVGSNDYSADMWIKTTDGVADLISAFNSVSPHSGFLFGIGFSSVTDGKLAFYHSENTSGNSETFGGTISVNDDKWHHIAFTKSGTSLKFFVDGALDSTHTTTKTSTNSNQAILIGRDNNTSPGRYYTGYMDELRISQGIARWTAAFTPPTRRYGVMSPEPNDLEIYHDGTHSYIDGTTTGDLYVRSLSDDVVIQGSDDVFIYTQGGEDAIIARGNGEVSLYYDNAVKLATTSTGVTVTGGVVTDSTTLTSTSFYPLTSGMALGSVAKKWALNATTGNFSGAITGGGFLTLPDTYGLTWGDLTNRIEGHSTNNTVDIYTNNTLAFSLSAAQAATFSGNATFNGAVNINAQTAININADCAGNVGYAAQYFNLDNTTTDATGHIRLARTAGTAFLGMEIAADAKHGIRFLTTDGGTLTERLKIDQNGNSIFSGALTGTTATFSGDVKAAQFYTGYDWTSRSGGINIGNQGLTTGAVSFYDGVLATSASIYRDSSSVFFVGARGGTQANGIAIATDGKVGIGTTAPANLATLDVRGRISVRENVAGELQFGTAAAYTWMEAFDGSADRTPKLPIAINPWGGNVGIGTSAPGATLTLSDGTDAFDFDVTTNALSIKTTTADGADDQSIYIDTGAGSSTRGAYVYLFGNEASVHGGKAIYQCGNVTGAAHIFRKAGGVDAVTITKDGKVGINKTPNSAVTLSLNAPASNTTNYGLEICNASANTRFLVDGVGNTSFYGSDNSLSARVTSDGKVGIGTAAPGVALDVVGSARFRLDTGSLVLKRTSTYTQNWSFGISHLGSATYGSLFITPTLSTGNIYIRDSSSNYLVSVLGSGKVGIGTTDPLEKLTLNGGTGDGATYDVAQRFQRTSSTGNVLASKIVFDDQDTNWGDLKFKMKTTASAGESGSFWTDALTIEGRYGKVGIGTTAPAQLLHLEASEVKLRLKEAGAEAWDLYAAGTRFAIQQDGTERFTIKDTGKVGIGTTAPAHKLDVVSATASDWLTRLHNTSTTAPSGLLIQTDIDTSGYLLGAVSAGVWKFVVLNNGYTGIGTVAPAATLDVHGSMVRISSGGGSYRRLMFFDSLATPSRNNFQVAVQEIDNALHIGPSTAVGGTTFSGSTGLAMLANGNVGIGTAAPLSKFNVKGTQGNWRVDPDSVSSEIQVLSTTVANDGFRSFRLRTNETIFDTGGSERMRITSAGKVFIGDTTASNAQLRVKQSTSGEWAANIINHQSVAYGLSIDTSSAASTAAYSFAAYTPAGTGFFLKNTGNVGIGTAVPTCILDVRQNVDANTKQHLINPGQSTAGRETEFIFGKDNGANLTGTLKYYYHTTQASRRIDLFHYGTTNGLSILNGGQVGIGTTAPGANLDSNTNTNWSSGWANNLRLTSVYYPCLRFFAQASNKTSLIGNNHDGGLWFGVNGSGDAFSGYAMVIKPDGQVGIGTTAPSAKLFVAGDSTARAIQAVGSSTSSGTGYFYTNAVHTGADTNATVSIRSDHALSSGQILHVRGAGSGNLLTLNQGGTDRLVVQAGGNVGIGVAPIAVNTSHKSLQIGGNANIQSYGTTGASGEVDFCHNVYLHPDGNYKLISADEATMYRQGGGNHKFYSWASGTAGSNVIADAAATKLTINSAGATFSGNTAFNKISSNLVGAVSGMFDIGTSSLKWRNLNMSGVMDLSGVNKIHQISGHNFAQGDATMTYLYGGSGGGQIRTANNSTSLVQWLDSGRIGIGATTNPGSMLELVGGTINGTTQYPGISGKHGSTQLYRLEQWFGNEGFLGLYKNGIRTIQLRGGESSSGAAHSYINTGVGNNFGIGTTVPAQKLHVNGGNAKIESSSNVYLSLDTTQTNGDEWHIFNAVSGTTSGLQFKDVDTSKLVMLLQEDGNVGIGTAAPGAALDVAGAVHISPNTVGANTFRFTTNAANDGRILIKSSSTDKVDIQANGDSYFTGGKVGIGTAAPTTPLYVTGTITASEGSIILNQADFGSKFAIISRNPVPSILGGSPFFWATTYNSAGSAVVANSSFTHDSSGVLTIRHGSASTQYQPARLSIKADGKVGIGTASPGLSDQWLATAETLSVIGSSLAGSVEVGHSEITNNVIFGALKFVNPDNSDASQATNRFVAGMYSRCVTSDSNAGDDSGGSLHFTVKPESSTMIDAIAILSDGKVGIGTVSPASPLDTVGRSSVRYSSTSTTKRIDIESGNTSNSIQYVTNPLHIYNNSNVTMALLQNGKVGIGTTAPSSTLSIHNGGAAWSSANLSEAVSGAIMEIAPLRTGSSAGIYFGNVSSTIGYIQGASTNGVTSYDFCINPYGGNVGIGTAAAGNKLQVNGPVSITDYLKHDGDADTYLLFETNKSSLYGGGLGLVVSSGQVGIGTSAPQAKTDIVEVYTDSVSAVEGLQLLIRGGQTDLSPTGDSIGLGFGYGSANNYVKTGIINEFTSTNGTSSLHLCTTATTGVATITKADARLTVKSDGKVGIGTSPSYKFEVVTGASEVGFEYDTHANGTQTIKFNPSSTKAGGTSKIYSSYAGTGATEGKLALGTYSAQTALVIDSAGRVGIGTSTPNASYKLDVVGSIRTNSTLSASSIASATGNFSGAVGMGALTGTSATFSSYIRANYGIKDDSGSYGTSGQVLQSGGTGVVNWGNGSATVADGAVTSAKIATDAVTQAKMADGSVGTSQLVSYSVSAGKIANNAVTGDKLAGWRTYTVIWGTAQTGITFVSDTVLRIAHGLGTKFIIHSILDNSGTVAAAANSYIDVNHYADVYAKYINDNTTEFIFAADRTNGQMFRFAMLGN